MKRPSGKFNAASPNTVIPEDLTGMALYFFDVSDVPVYAPLHRQLLLISEDNSSTSHHHDSNMVFGYLMSEPLPKTFQDFFGKATKSFPGWFRFLQIMNSETEKFEPEGVGFITFITNNREPLNTLNEKIFGNFAAYNCETLEEATEMAKYLKDKTDIVMVHSEFAIERERIIPLIKSGRVLLREAIPERMLNQSAFMRTLHTFPESAPNFKP